MWLEYETALKAAMEGAVPGAAVLGSLDQPEFDDTVELYVHVVWLGYGIEGQSVARTEAALIQRFAVRVGSNAAAPDDAQALALSNGLAEVLRRVLAFRYGERPGHIKATLIQPPAPAWQGGAGELAVYFTLPGVATARPAP